MNTASAQPQVLRNALKLFTGTGAAQILMLIFVPLLTRIYSTAQFGAFGAFMALSNLTAVLSTGRYEMAVQMPKTTDEAFQVLKLALGAGTLVSLVLAVAAFSARDIGFFSLAGWELCLVPVGTFLVMGITCFESWLNRSGRYTKVSTARIAGAVVLIGVQAVLGWQGESPVNGLILGFVAGMALTFLVDLYFARDLRGGPTTDSIKTIALRYRRFPTFLLPSQILASATNHLPTLIFKKYFGDAKAGTYFTASRTLTMGDLVCTAVGQVFYIEAARAHADGRSCLPLLRSTTLRLLAMAVVGFPILFFVAPDACALIFGEEWRESGYLIRMLIPMSFVRFVTVPSNLFFTIVGKQDWFLYRQIFLGMMVVASCYVGVRDESFPKLLTLYSSAFVVAYLIDAVLAFRLAAKAPRPAPQN